MTLTDEESITDFLDKLDKESRAIKKETLELCWYMRGGITYDEAMHLSLTERNIIMDIVEDHLEVTKKTQMPFF